MFNPIICYYIHFTHKYKQNILNVLSIPESIIFVWVFGLADASLVIKIGSAFLGHFLTFELRYELICLVANVWWTVILLGFSVCVLCSELSSSLIIHSSDDFLGKKHQVHVFIADPCPSPLLCLTGHTCINNIIVYIVYSYAILLLWQCLWICLSNVF